MVNSRSAHGLGGILILCLPWVEVNCTEVIDTVSSNKQIGILKLTS